MKFLNRPGITIFFDREKRTGWIDDDAEFQIDVDSDGEVKLFMNGEKITYSEAREITNKHVRAEIVTAFESIIEEERIILDSFFEPDPDFEHDNRNI